MSWPPLRLLKHGQFGAGNIGTCYGGSVSRSGWQRLTLNAPLLVNCGIRSIGLMGRRHALMSVTITGDDMHRFFDFKVADVRASTSDAPPPSFSAAPLGCVLRAFRQLRRLRRLLPDKQCNSDPLSTRQLKVNIDVLAPFLVELFNRSLTLSVVPTTFKLAYITLLPMIDLDPADARSYRVSNLSILSKLLERIVTQHLIDYLKSSKLLPRLQGAYRVVTQQTPLWLDRNGGFESTGGHSVSSGGRPCDANVIRSDCRFRHSRPHDAPASSRRVVWCQWQREQMVYFVSQR